MSRTSVRHDVILVHDTPRMVADAGRRPAAADGDGEKNRRQPGSPGKPNRLSNRTMFPAEVVDHRCYRRANKIKCSRRRRTADGLRARRRARERCNPRTTTILRCVCPPRTGLRTLYAARVSLTKRRHDGGRDVITSVVRGVGPRPEHSVRRSVEDDVSCARPTVVVCGPRAQKSIKRSYSVREPKVYLLNFVEHTTSAR